MSRGQGIRSICWDCSRACGGCSWSRSFRPVKGWDAVPTKIASHSHNGDGEFLRSSYAVISCPLFDRDAIQYGMKWLKKQNTIIRRNSKTK